MTTILTGVITDIFPDERFGSFKKKVFWLQELNVTPDKAQIWQLEVFNDDGIAMLSKFKPEDSVTCNVRILGRRWKDKVLTTLKCDMIKKF